MNKKVLIAVSEHGFWVEELLKPMDHLDAAGIGYHFVSPKGNITPFPDGASLNAEYVDPPLGRQVTSPDLARRGKETDWEELFGHRHTLEKWFPVRPYLSADGYLGTLERYYEERRKAWKLISEYDALLLVGGSGPVVDMVNNNRLHDLILGFYYAGKPIAAECYTVTCLAFARELDTRESILRGKHVTGHTMEYDYTAGWSILANGEYFTFETPPYPLEYILRDTVGPNGKFHGNVGRLTSVIVDYPFITSRSVASSDLCGRLLVEVLTNDLKRFGW
ncbi:type 1 glutamine amidotransferase domain-containing protein [Bremerella cremea]|uniref:Type 1 glutamine amidotransferase domain-containing protein n=1 Tax=Bremerella cremea TaxID=1031537 RepID=A0A368KNP1_9BACT|nr:type 1 glutamine amidotransferase domain-containing protein [Bremerella cremea]RCS42045.1 type 1 glutamine amidotransferase domain-containing protein [Bremerella cremea]